MKYKEWIKDKIKGFIKKPKTVVSGLHEGYDPKDPDLIKEAEFKGLSVDDLIDINIKRDKRFIESRIPSKFDRGSLILWGEFKKIIEDKFDCDDVNNIPVQFFDAGLYDKSGCDILKVNTRKEGKLSVIYYKGYNS